MSNYFIFNGISSADMGIFVGGQNTFGAPERDVEVISVPGRNGDLILDNGRFKNAEISYRIFIPSDFIETADEIRQWLSSPTDYARLEDTYHPDEYRMARLKGKLEFEPKKLNKYAVATIAFDCMPQRFLKGGEIGIERSIDFGESTPSEIENETYFDSKPLIRMDLTAPEVADEYIRVIFKIDGYPRKTTLTINKEQIYSDFSVMGQMNCSPEYLMLDTETMSLALKITADQAWYMAHPEYGNKDIVSADEYLDISRSKEHFAHDNNPEDVEFKARQTTILDFSENNTAVNIIIYPRWYKI